MLCTALQQDKMPQSSQSCGLCDKGHTQSPSQAGPATWGYHRCNTPLPKPGQVKRQLHVLELRHSTTEAHLRYSQAPASVRELHRAQVAHHLLLEPLRQLDLGGVAGDEEPCNHGQPNRPVKRITAWRPAAPPAPQGRAGTHLAAGRAARRNRRPSARPRPAARRRSACR